MGKMKEIFMKTNYPFGDTDLEREYLIDDMLVKEKTYEEYQALQNSPEMNESLNTKIKIADATTRIEIGKKESINSQHTEIF
jgi:hypothetical protein